MRRAIAVAVAVVLVAAATILGLHLRPGSGAGASRQLAARSTARATVTPATDPTPNATADPTVTPAPAPPASAQLNVPYTAQAPYGVWDAAHEHYCTAAATVMAQQFYLGDTRVVIPPAEADQKMTAIIDWDRQTFAGVIELPLPDVEQAAAAQYGLKGTIEQASYPAIEAAIAAGHPVVLALMTHGEPGGQAIAPYYSAGNTHHVILVTGYDATQGVVYANDPGFMQGRHYTYQWSALQSAIAQEQPLYDAGGTMLILTPA